MTSWNGAVSRLPEACCASDPNADVPPPTERLASPPAPRFALPPPLPRSPPVEEILSYPSKVSPQRSGGVCISADGQNRCRPRGRGATRRSPQREGIRQHPAPPDPPPRILGPLRSSQMKHARGGDPAIVQQAPSMRAPCSHTPRGPLKHERSVRGLFSAHFLLKKRPKNRLRYVTASQ